MKWLLDKARFVRTQLIVLSALSIVYSVFGVSFALVSKKLIDVATGQAEGHLAVLSLVLVFMLIFELTLQSLINIIDVKTKGRLSIICRDKFFSAILKKDFSAVSALHSGDILNRITSDLTLITDGITEILPEFLLLITKVIASFAAVFFLDPIFALLCLLIGPIIILSSRFYNKKLKLLHKKCQETDGMAKSFIQEVLKNLLVIKSFSNEDAISKESAEIQKINYKYTLRRSYISLMVNILYYIAMTIGYYAALAWGAYKISAGIMTFGTLTALLQLVGQIQMPFRSLASIVPRYYSMLASAERIQEIENLPDDDTKNQKTVRECTDMYEKLDKISIENIYFRYEDKYILENFSAEIKKSDFLVITGESGIGKSTLIKLLLGIFTPESGDIYLVFNDGSRKKITPEMRRIFAYVPQGNMILSGTIRDNITFASKQYTDDKIIEAAKAAQIWDYIKTLPDGLDTKLGESGTGLSEGQTQRLAIARALLYGAPILLLDESTSAVDEATELAILRSIKALKNKTCIIITHKNAAMSFCDKNIIFKNTKEHSVSQ